MEVTVKSKAQTIEAPACAFCGVIACESVPGLHRPPKFCAMTGEPKLFEDAEISYIEHEDLHKLAIAAAQTESSGYMVRTRIEDIMDFARRTEVEKIGIAHCVGLIQEARLAAEIFIANGFIASSVCCKVGSIPKENIGLRDEDKIKPGEYEPLCNPVAQAALLEKAGTQLNVVIGLCVGHDSLFFMHSKAPTTVLVVKDRVMGHNPVAALYTSSTYYRRLTKPG
jgi:uncharacterized metal-binding protein